MGGMQIGMPVGGPGSQVGPGQVGPGMKGNVMANLAGITNVRHTINTPIY